MRGGAGGAGAEAEAEAGAGAGAGAGGGESSRGRESSGSGGRVSGVGGHHAALAHLFVPTCSPPLPASLAPAASVCARHVLALARAIGYEGEFHESMTEATAEAAEMYHSQYI